MTRYYIVGPHREVVWPNRFRTRQQAIHWRDMWVWGKGCKILRVSA